MKSLKTISAVALAAILFTSTLYAQASASATAAVAAQLSKGLAVSNVGGNLDFGETILTGGASSPSITNQNGANFEVLGHPNRNVTITFNTVNLTNDAWNTSMGGGVNDVLVFTPTMDETGSSAAYAGAVAVISGNTLPLPNVTGTGTLYLWVGGSIAIGAAQEHGDYVGTFQVDVAY